MKPLVTSLLALLLATTAFASDKKQDLSISLSTGNDSRARLAARHELRDARLVITTRHRAAVLLLLDDAVAVQLSDSAMGEMKTKDDAGFLEELVIGGVRLALGKAVEYPIAHIRSVDVRDGVLVLTSDDGKPVFDEIRINGENVTHDIAPADAARFVNAFRALKSKH